jgi:hypothetical protein
MLPVLFEELGRKQHNSAIGRNEEDGLPRLQAKPGKVFRGFPSGFAPAKNRQPRLNSGGNENAVLTVFRYAGSEKNPDRMATRDPGSFHVLAKEGQAKA